MKGPVNEFESSEQYKHCLPLEAAALSKNGLAIGYDLLKWGEEYHSRGCDEGSVAAIASKSGVKILFRTAYELIFIEGEKSESSQDYWIGKKARRRLIDCRNFYIWESITGQNKDFLLSLHWDPEEPVGALEALALASI